MNDTERSRYCITEIVGKAKFLYVLNKKDKFVATQRQPNYLHPT